MQKIIFLLIGLCISAISLAQSSATILVDPPIVSETPSSNLICPPGSIVQDGVCVTEVGDLPSVASPTTVVADGPAVSDADYVKQLVNNIKGCMWVDSIYESNEPSDASAYQVPGCGGSFESKRYVCTGTLKCSLRTQSSGSASVFFENVMCSAKGEKCPAATDCLKEGGALKSVSLRNNNGADIVRPVKSNKSVNGAN